MVAQVLTKAVSKANHSTSQESKSMPWPLMPKKLKLTVWRPTRPPRINTHKHTHTQRCSFHPRGKDAKVASQEIHGITSKFGLGIQNTQGNV